VSEVSEGFVDRFTRGADELRDLLLGQVVRHAQRGPLLSAESLRQVEQLLGDATRDVGEDQV
jgi:hypothetical protein